MWMALAQANITVQPDGPEPRDGEDEAAASPVTEPPATLAEQTLDEIVAEVADPLAQIERQIEAEETDYAIHWLKDRIENIESLSHRFDPGLVRPLTLLGDAYAADGDYGTALGHYQRAVHLSRVNHGLNAPDQVEIVYREANAFKALGDYQQANDREEYAYHVLSRSHAPMDEELLPGIYHLADWYKRTNNVFAARALYEQALRIIDGKDRLNSLEAVPALEGIATSYKLERFPPYYLSGQDPSESSIVSTSMQQPISINNFPAGEAALQRIIRIHQEQPQPDPIATAEAVLELADWYTLFDKPRRAHPLYAHAWELMAAVEDFDVASYFADPALLYFPTPDNPSPPPVSQRGERATGYVEVSFGVTDDGYVRDLGTVASVPDGLMDFRVRKSLRLARYRPMLVDGVPVAKDQHTYRHEFPYYEERPEDSAASADATDTAVSG